MLSESRRAQQRRKGSFMSMPKLAQTLSSARSRQAGVRDGKTRADVRRLNIEEGPLSDLVNAKKGCLACLLSLRTALRRTHCLP